MAVSTYDGATVRLFVMVMRSTGGLLCGPLDHLVPDTNEFYIVDCPGCELHNFLGTIDEIRVWSGELSAPEIRSAFDQANQTAVRGGTLPTQLGQPGASGNRSRSGPSEN